jgi:hypothetical protein
VPPLSDKVEPDSRFVESDTVRLPPEPMDKRPPLPMVSE